MEQLLDNVKPLSKKILDTIPPLKDGEVAVFRLTNAYVKEDNREEFSVREVAQFSGVEQVNDPFDDVNKTKLIGTFIKDYKALGNTGKVKPIYEPVVFVRGEVRIGSDNIALYNYMMTSKKSGANKFRMKMGAKKGSKPEWELVGMKSVINMIQVEELRFQAERMIRESQIEELKSIATKLNESPDVRFKVKSYVPGSLKVDPQSMKLELIQLARQFPKQVISASSDEASKLKVQIYDAMVYGILIFERNAYHLLTDKDIFELYTPESDTDSVESLIKYFTSEQGNKNYVKFATELKKALKV
jgi:hypothetical protein